MAVTTSMDVESTLRKTIDPKVLEESITVYKERYKNNCLIKPKKALPYHFWWLIHKQVKKLGGRWSKKQRLWEVPLNEHEH